ncbi:DUF1697 domain-containing protein [Lapidilactobacillus bayanensis]|uniref:DUF1697 domain-containing protein n=1 Tax=Lapidilactobacillus bayanensis TaxID=2485998 RepID=UPI000F7786A9|nr:DUF1697 domain-containing protein [Lapidilactobacillus bayanensis]
MTKYLALLRGINVGGKTKVMMSELKQVFSELGFKNVQTYINSGNVLFTTDQTDILNLQAQCQAAIAAHFGIEVPVAVLSVTDLATAVSNVSNWWGHDPEVKHNAIVVIPPTQVETVLGEVVAAKPEYEQVETWGQVIFWSAPIKTFSRTRWAKVATKASYRKITIRNANTIYKLLKLATEN